MPVEIPINLASAPFRRNRALIVASVAASVALTGLLAVLISMAISGNREQDQTTRNIDRVRKQLDTMAREQSKLEATLRRPENAEVLDRSIFLNKLLYRKGISWTKIFADLEKVMPYNVRLISVHPRENAQNEVSLDMVVGAESYQPVIELLTRMENSPLFGETAVHATVPPSQNDPLFKYRVSVNYSQKLGDRKPEEKLEEKVADGPAVPAT
jgi:type IV pilus assembly protein PilN